MDANLIYDVGFHIGEDTEYYLKKGFRVVAIEANPELCRLGSEAFSGPIASGQLTLVNLAIAEKSGPITFFRNKQKSIWGTLNADWADRNRRRGAESEPITVGAVTMRDLFERYGVPYYIKIDIEGSDLVALRGLGAAATRPKFVSIESEKDSFRALRREFDILLGLGYDEFKIVPQRHIGTRQTPPKPAREGAYAAHTFRPGSSGLFGEEAPGRWMNVDASIRAYKRIFLRYVLTGDDPLLNSSLLINTLKILGMRGEWYDTHARRSASACPTDSFLPNTSENLTLQDLADCLKDLEK